MIIHVEAPKHPNFQQLEEYYKSTLSEKYAPFEFIKAIEVKVNKEKDDFAVKLIVDLEKDPMAFVQSVDAIEGKAFKDCLHKLDKIVRKYKTKHYRG